MIFLFPMSIFFKLFSSSIFSFEFHSPNTFNIIGLYLLLENFFNDIAEFRTEFTVATSLIKGHQ